MIHALSHCLRLSWQKGSKQHSNYDRKRCQTEIQGNHCHPLQLQASTQILPPTMDTARCFHRTMTLTGLSHHRIHQASHLMKNLLRLLALLALICLCQLMSDVFHKKIQKRTPHINHLKTIMNHRHSLIITTMTRRQQQAILPRLHQKEVRGIKSVLARVPTPICCHESREQIEPDRLNPPCLQKWTQGLKPRKNLMPVWNVSVKAKILTRPRDGGGRGFLIYWNTPSI